MLGVAPGVAEKRKLNGPLLQTDLKESSEAAAGPMINSESRIQLGTGTIGARKFMDGDAGDFSGLPGGASALMAIDDNDASSDHESERSGAFGENSVADQQSICSPPVKDEGGDTSPFVIRSPAMKRGMSA